MNPEPHALKYTAYALSGRLKFTDGHYESNKDILSPHQAGALRCASSHQAVRGGVATLLREFAATLTSDAGALLVAAKNTQVPLVGLRGGNCAS